MRNIFIIVGSLLVIGIAVLTFYHSTYWLLLYIPVLPSYAIGLHDYFQTDNTVKRNYPLLGRLRYLMEDLRPKIYQYFVESDIDGRPFNRLNREIVYNRSKGTLDTSPFGTQLDIYNEGYEWMNHSIGSVNPRQMNHSPRIKIGGPDCQEAYFSSVLNISAMSYGSLSKNAVLALNGGAKIGSFAHNTGEGGISPYHLKNGGDLIYQIGTGYFGCRSKDGSFNEAEFREKAKIDAVKMIELKLSQGAKPGHGGILPGKKNTKEIAEIRGVEPGTDVVSPPHHTAFSTPLEMMHFIARLRELAKGKPIGFKLCVGDRREIIAICKAIVKTGIKPDYVAVDGSEGGTGAAPLEFSNSVGMPFKEGVATVYDALVGFDLKKDIALIASGKVTTGFDMVRAFALGADACYAARAMMLALGCIQAKKCNTNSCPTGITTHKNSLMQGLVPEDKKHKVANYHKETVESFVELTAAAGLRNIELINRSMIKRRLNVYESRSFEDIFPYLPKGSLLERSNVPSHWQKDLNESIPESFLPKNLAEKV
jgi:glutamate synthase domain-containing protein 2